MADITKIKTKKTEKIDKFKGSFQKLTQYIIP